ncbi:PEP-CTERM sorting domain-containing protein [Massilia sp. 2TAF26]|uniref:PEP-CTERM sorting domain-containing protein n=1 Tax=Massilia sp. 2TAF26 TaxID=3233012 RepID=UPI003F9C13A2
MTIRYLIGAALMAGACVAHADVIPAAGGAGIVNGSNVAGAVGDSSVIAGVNRGAGSDALVQALYQKVSASVGSDMKVSLRQGIDGVYVTGLSTAKAAALAGDGMSVVATPDGYKIVDNSGGNSGAGNSTAGGGAQAGNNGGANSGITTPNTGAPTETGANTGTDKLTGNGNTSTEGGIGGSGGNGGIGGNTDISIGIGNGNGNGSGNLADATDLPEPSTVALMLAGLLGVAGLGRRRAR